MKRTIHLLRTLLLAAAVPLAACGGSPRRHHAPKSPHPETVQPAEYTYVVRHVYPHLRESYTQGLYFDGGILWEGTGQYGESQLLRADLETGRTEVVARLPRTDFGEGIARLGERIYQLTWQSNRAYVYDAATGERLREFRYAGEGWGLTADGERLYLSDGTADIHILDPETFRRTGRVTVTLAGEPLYFINELEWIDGKIWANVYTTDLIVIIDPATGIVEGVVDLSGLLPEADYARDTDVLNGIAWDAEGRRLFVTGKKWPKLFEIEVIRK